MSNKERMSYFGFRLVTKDEKTFMVNNVFHSVAKRYDLMNDLMSFGLHRIWKNFLVKHSKIQSGYRVLDVAGGTGDLTVKFARLVGKTGIVVLLDINNSMIEVARKRLGNLGIVGNVYYVQANAEFLPFMSNIFDCISISFGLRNISEKEKALSSMYRVLKPGGQLLVLDFSKPICGFVNEMYNVYSFFLPYIGKMVVQDFSSYRYLIESIRMHPDQKELEYMLYQLGFKSVRYFNMLNGIVVLHCGYK